MRTFILVALVSLAAACTPPEAPPVVEETPVAEPLPGVSDGGSSEDYAALMARGEGVWTRRSGACAITMEFFQATGGTLVRREAGGDDPAEMRVTVEPNNAR